MPAWVNLWINRFIFVLLLLVAFVLSYPILLSTSPHGQPFDDFSEKIAITLQWLAITGGPIVLLAATAAILTDGIGQIVHGVSWLERRWPYWLAIVIGMTVGLGLSFYLSKQGGGFGPCCP